MKKYFLLTAILFCNSILSAQILNSYPDGFRKAELPQKWKNFGVKILPSTSNRSHVSVVETLVKKNIPILRTSTIVEEYLGISFYDFQINGGSMSNRLLVNNDGTVSASWMFSPNAIQTTTPPFPSRGTGYNYWDGTNWIYPAGPSSRQESIRTGFPNIVVTPSGKELIVSHALRSNQSDSNYIAVTRRQMKGTGNWDTLIVPWGTNVCHSLPKACGGLTNENVYMIFQGKGGVLFNQQTPPSTIDGFYGPVYFARSLDGGLTWSTPVIIPLIDSTNYRGFTGDSYSIFARGDTVAISYGHIFMDVGLLKSTDAGLTWTKKIIQLHPQPMYDINGDSLSDINLDGIADTISSNGGDSKVLIDNNGMCHVWFSALRYINNVAGDTAYTLFYGTDNLYYWNESMPQNNGYVAIAAAQDFNGDGIINFPAMHSGSCFQYPWGDYGGGITQIPSAGIDANGKIYLAYQTVDERTDTMYGALHRHIFMMTLAPIGGIYNAANWTYPYGIVPFQAAGGYGEFQEAVYACVSPNVGSNDVYVMYQRDEVQGQIYSDTACGLGNSSDIIITKVNVNTVGIPSFNSPDLFVSQNYPNPCNWLTYMDIGLKETMEISIHVFDLEGRSVYREKKGVLPAGLHTLTLNVSSLSAGVYTYSITANGEKSTRKLIVIK